MNAKRARKIIITPTVMPHVTPKQKSRNIILHPIYAVAIAVIMSYLLVPYGNWENLVVTGKYGLFRPFYPYFRQFRRAGPDSTRDCVRYENSLVDFGLLGYYFYILMGYFCNLFFDNAFFVALSCSCYLLVHAIAFIFDQITGKCFNPLRSNDFLRMMTWL